MSHRILSIVITALCGTAAFAQTPTFRLQVEYVEVDARVTDSNGNFVRDLTKEDFQILEDGKPQPLAAFSLVDIPTGQAVSSSVSIESDVQSNERHFDGRVYVMILDDASTAPDRTARTRNASRGFIEQHLGANDLMAIVFTSATGEAAQDFTADKRLLLAAVDKFTGQEVPERTLAQPIGPGTFTTGPPAAGALPPQPLEPVVIGVNACDPLPTFTAAGNRESLADGNVTVTTLGRVATWLNGITGRKKAVIFVSDGFVYDPSRLADDVRPTGRIGRTNLNIYAVDMRGPGVTQTPTDQLTMLTENTGGFAVMDNNDIDRGFDRIVAENSTYYMLAYYPSNARDGKVHPIDVRVKRPGVTVRARRAFAAPTGDSPSPRFAANVKTTSGTVGALNSPVPLSDLRMRMFAAPFGATPQAQVLVGIDFVGPDLPLDTGGAVEIAYLAVDAKGIEHGWRTDRLNLNLNAGMRTRVEQSGVRVLRLMQLPPGRYRLHVAAHDSARKLSGSLLYDLDVPDLGKTDFAMSGVALMSKSGAATVTAHVDEEIKAMLPGTPTAARSFPQDDELAVFAEVYDNGARPWHQVEVVTTVRSAEGEVVFERTDDHESNEFKGTRGALRHTTRIPFKTFEPGSYVLSVEAKSSLDADRTIVRQVPFTVTAVEPGR
jgi:VWFA-related protein